MTGQINAYHHFFYQGMLFLGSSSEFEQIHLFSIFQNRKFLKIEKIIFDRPMTQEEIRFHH